jgi:hypothetical protein
LKTLLGSWQHGRVFLKTIPCHPKDVKHLVLARVVLHNFLSVADLRYADESYGDRYHNGRLSAGQWRQDISERDARLAVSKTWLPKWAKMPHMQRKIAITRGSFFNNECNVPWQEEYFLEPE